MTGNNFLSSFSSRYFLGGCNSYVIESLQVANSIAGSQVKKVNQLADAFLSVNLSLLNASR